MLKNNLLSYFLDKPGTYDSLESDKLRLNVASKEVMTIRNGNELLLEVRMNTQMLDYAKDRFNMQVINNDPEFKRCRINVDNNMLESELFELIDMSYESVMDTLPENEKNEILDLEW